MTPSLVRKAARDLATDPTRSLLAALAIAVGAFGMTTVLDAYATLGRDLAAGFRDTRPAAAILWTDAPTDRAVRLVRACPGVRDAEARALITGRVRTGHGDWEPLALFAVRDFADVRIDRIERVAGAWPAGPDEVALERTALGVAHSSVGGALDVRLDGGRTARLRVSGAAHAGGLPPAWMDHVVTGFVPWTTALDGAARAGAIRLTVADSALDAAHVYAVARRAAAVLVAHGAPVTRIDVPPPGRHPHADQMDAFLFLLGAFAALALVLSALLVAGLVESWLARERREIGVLKAIGARDAQVARLYLAEVAVLALLGTGLGVGLGRIAGRAYAQFSATMLNLPLAPAGAPAWALACELLLALGAPLVVSGAALARASRLTVREALDHDAGATGLGPRPFDRALARLAFGPLALRRALRATLRRPARLARTALTLALGGALFVAATSTGLAWTRALAVERAAHRYDFDVRLAHPTPPGTVARAAAATPAVAAWEGAGEAGADLLWPSSPPATRVLLVTAPVGSRTLALPLARGRALVAADSDAAIVNEALLAKSPGLGIGAWLPLAVQGRTVRLRVAGVVHELMPYPTVYAPAAWVARVAGAAAGERPVRTLRVVATRGATDAAAAFEQALAREGVEVAQSVSVAERLRALADHLVILRTAVLLAAVLVLVVGLLGVATWLGMEVIERTREIGIVSALGARPGDVFAQFVFEGAFCAAFAWPIALGLAAPIAYAIESVTGRIFFHAPLVFAYSPAAALAWLPLSIALAALGSALPAQRAARLSVQEALRHA